MELPIKTNAIVYFVQDNQPKVLILKRIPEDGDFWQTITGTLEDGESLETCAKREILEETSISSILKIIPNIHSFYWFKKDGTPITEYVFAVQVEANTTVILSHEHYDFEWLSPTQAIEKVKHDTNKIAIKKLEQILSN